jgi:hypothetical protein
MVFTASIVTGMAAGNAGTTTILRSVYAFIAAWLVGSVVGSIAERTITRNIAEYKKANPIPKTHEDLKIVKNEAAGLEGVEAGIEAGIEVGEEVVTAEELTSRPAA